MGRGITFTLLAVAALCALSDHAAAATARQQRLAPLGAWIMNYGKDRCSLIRTFGTKDDYVTLSLERFGPTRGASVSLIGKRLGSVRWRQPVQIAFGAGAVPSRVLALTGTAGANRTPLVILGAVGIVPDPPGGRAAMSAAEEAADARGLTEVTVTPMPGKPVVLETGRLDQPLQAMETCTDAMLRNWGLDPAVQHDLGRNAAPTSDPQTWLAPADYPYVPLIQGESSLIRFRLMVGPDGMPTSCAVQSRTSIDSFADRTCKLLMQRARFTPALDRAGKPVATVFIGAVQWLAHG